MTPNCPDCKTNENECEHLYEDTKKTDAGRRIGKCVKCGFILVGLLYSDFVVPQENPNPNGRLFDNPRRG